MRSEDLFGPSVSVEIFWYCQKSDEVCFWPKARVSYNDRFPRFYISRLNDLEEEYIGERDEVRHFLTRPRELPVHLLGIRS